MPQGCGAGWICCLFSGRWRGLVVNGNDSGSTVRQIGLVFNVVIRISARCYLYLPAAPLALNLLRPRFLPTYCWCHQKRIKGYRDPAIVAADPQLMPRMPKSEPTQLTARSPSRSTKAKIQTKNTTENFLQLLLSMQGALSLHILYANSGNNKN